MYLKEEKEVESNDLCLPSPCSVSLFGSLSHPSTHQYAVQCGPVGVWERVCACVCDRGREREIERCNNRGQYTSTSHEGTWQRIKVLTLSLFMNFLFICQYFFRPPKVHFFSLSSYTFVYLYNPCFALSVITFHKIKLGPDVSGYLGVKNMKTKLGRQRWSKNIVQIKTIMHCTHERQRQNEYQSYRKNETYEQK